MNKTIVTLLAVLFFGLTIPIPGFAKVSGYPDYVNIDNVELQYKEALQSSNAGLIESALFESVKLQIFAPKHNFSDLIKSANKVVEKTKSAELRYKAFVVAQFLQHPDWLNNMENINELWQVSRFKGEGDKLFAMLADELQNHYLVLARIDEK